MESNLISYARKINGLKYILSLFLFLSVIGIIPLFGYMINVSNERIKNGPNSNPPSLSNFPQLVINGIILFSILLLTLVPSGLIYILMPILIQSIEIGESLIISILLMTLALTGVILSLLGMYMFIGLLFTYSRYAVDSNLTLLDSLEITITQVFPTRKYFDSVFYFVIISLIFGLLTELLLPLGGIFSIIYITLTGYIIGSLSSEFIINDTKSHILDIDKLNISTNKINTYINNIKNKINTYIND